ncbi:unnamed protein product [Prunus brigantina]
MGPKDSHFPELSLPNTGPFIPLQDLKLSIPLLSTLPLTRDDAAMVLLDQMNLICSRNRLNLCAILSTEMSSTRPC